MNEKGLPSSSTKHQEKKEGFREEKSIGMDEKGLPKQQHKTAWGKWRNLGRPHQILERHGLSSTVQESRASEENGGM
jgi:hypothetical protein